LLNKEPSKLTEHQIKLLKGIANRIAHQIDIQTDQKEITAKSVQSAVKSFTKFTHSENFTDLTDFLSLCLGKPVSDESFSKFVDLGLAEYNAGDMILSQDGKTLQTRMKLQTKVMKRSVIKTQNKPTFLDELLGEL
jgi:hypothetical protein